MKELIPLILGFEENKKYRHLIDFSYVHSSLHHHRHRMQLRLVLRSVHIVEWSTRKRTRLTASYSNPTRDRTEIRTTVYIHLKYTAIEITLTVQKINIMATAFLEPLKVERTRNTNVILTNVCNMLNPKSKNRQIKLKVALWWSWYLYHNWTFQWRIHMKGRKYAWLEAIYWPGIGCIVRKVDILNSEWIVNNLPDITSQTDLGEGWIKV